MYSARRRQTPRKKNNTKTFIWHEILKDCLRTRNFTIGQVFTLHAWLVELIPVWVRGDHFWISAELDAEWVTQAELLDCLFFYVVFRIISVKQTYTVDVLLLDLLRVLFKGQSFLADINALSRIRRQLNFGRDCSNFLAAYVAINLPTSNFIIVFRISQGIAARTRRIISDNKYWANGP